MFVIAIAHFNIKYRYTWFIIFKAIKFSSHIFFSLTFDRLAILQNTILSLLGYRLLAVCPLIRCQIQPLFIRKKNRDQALPKQQICYRGGWQGEGGDWGGVPAVMSNTVERIWMLFIAFTWVKILTQYVWYLKTADVLACADNWLNCYHVLEIFIIPHCSNLWIYPC